MGLSEAAVAADFSQVDPQAKPPIPKASYIEYLVSMFGPPICFYAQDLRFYEGKSNLSEKVVFYFTIRKISL